MVRAADSVAANISEGFGRFHYKENRHFLYYARGSLFEFETWADKSLARAFLTEDLHSEMMKRVRALTAMLNRYSKSLGRKAASESK
jgi:four helix bundle protein